VRKAALRSFDLCLIETQFRVLGCGVSFESGTVDQALRRPYTFSDPLLRSSIVPPLAFHIEMSD
jgi:hypothetical protein